MCLIYLQPDVEEKMHYFGPSWAAIASLIEPCRDRDLDWHWAKMPNLPSKTLSEKHTCSQFIWTMNRQHASCGICFIQWCPHFRPGGGNALVATRSFRSFGNRSPKVVSEMWNGRMPCTPEVLTWNLKTSHAGNWDSNFGCFLCLKFHVQLSRVYRL